MKLIAITILASSLVHAAPPEVHRPDRYKDLYLNSPFTDEPEVVEESAEPDDLPDWALGGVVESINQTIITLINRKDQTRVKIPSPEADDLGFSVIEIRQNPGFLKNEVVLKKGPHSGIVTFDLALLTPKRVAAPAGNPAPQGGNNNRDPRQRGNQNNNNAAPPNVAVPPNPGQQPGTNQPPAPGTPPNAAPAANRPTTSGRPSSSNDRSRRTPRYIPRPSR